MEMQNLYLTNNEINLIANALSLLLADERAYTEECTGVIAVKNILERIAPMVTDDYVHNTVMMMLLFASLRMETAEMATS